MQQTTKSGFHRIGNKYATFIEPGQFWGRGPFEGAWLSPENKEKLNAEHCHLVQIALPGFSKKDISISLTYDQLKIHAKKSEHQQGILKYDSWKIGEERVETFFLPENIEREKITAQFSKGILSISIPVQASGTKGFQGSKIEVS